MTWAGNRRLIVLAIVLLGVIIALAATLVFVGPKEPTCSDGIHNGDEAGVDCGGSCAYLCIASLAEPSVVYARAVSSGARTDVVAYIENRNASAAVNDARYVVEVYDVNRLVLASHEGTLDLAPGAGTPVFITGIYEGEGVVGQASLTFFEDSLNWVSHPAMPAGPRAGEIRIEGTQDAPRIRATLFNSGVRPLTDVTLVLTAFDAGGIVIAASQTILPRIEAEGTASAIFTWNEPFRAEPVRIDIRPVISLP